MDRPISPPHTTENCGYCLLLVYHLRAFKYGSLDALCISLVLRGGLSQSVVVRVMLGEVQMWSCFVLFFLCVPGFYEETYFVRFKGFNEQFDLARLYECYYSFVF